MRRFVKRTADASLERNWPRRRSTVLRTTTRIVAVAFSLGLAKIRQSQNGDTRRERFTHNGGLEPEETAAAAAAAGKNLKEAPTGFDNETNGFDPQTPSTMTLRLARL